MLKPCLIALSISLSVISGYAQTGYQQKIDSLLKLADKTGESPERTKLLYKITKAYFSIPGGAIKDSFKKYSLLTIDLAKKIDDNVGLAEALYLKGRYYVGVEKKPAEATHDFLEGLNLFTELEDSTGMAKCYMQLGLISYILQYYDAAIVKFQLALKAREETTSKYLLALSYTELDSFSLAKRYLLELIENYSEQKYIVGLDDCHMWLGRVYLKTGQLDSAFFYINKTIARQEAQKDSFILVRAYAFISEAYFEANNVEKAKYYAKRSFDLETNKTNQSSDPISLIQATKILNKVFALLGDYKKAHFYLNLYNEESNRFEQDGTKQKVADMQSMFEFDQKMNLQKLRQQKDQEIAQEKISKERILRNAFIVGSVLLLVVLSVLYSRFNLKKKANQTLRNLNDAITIEKKRSDDLLLNILPEDVAEELKEKGHAEAKLMEHVTMLFTDFSGFTAIAEKLSAKELVHDLNTCFSEFDRIMEKYHVEKIKTIGDAYMAASGLSSTHENHYPLIIRAALEMIDFLEATKVEKIKAGKPFFEMRIGIHTGPVVAGIVGVKKFQYDVWGDTVNTASRMESSGEVGKVNISQTTYELLKDNPEFAFESRGKVAAKGKGEMAMWFVSKKTGEGEQENRRTKKAHSIGQFWSSDISKFTLHSPRAKH